MKDNEKNQFAILIQKYIKKDKYYEFSEPLKEIFMRRAELFDFSLQEMEAQLINFTNVCTNINLTVPWNMGRNLHLFNNNPLLVGDWDYENHSISINKLASISPKDYFEALTHEVYHAISQREDGTTGLTYLYMNENNQSKDKATMDNQNKSFDHIGISLNEAFNELAAHKSVYNKSFDSSEMTHEYPTLTFIPNLIANSVGLPYKDVVKAGLQNRNTFKNLLQNQFSKDQYNSLNEYFEKLEISLDGIYFLEYMPKGKIDKNQIALQIQLTKEFYKNIFNSSYDIAALQISGDKTPITKEYAISLEKRLDQIVNIENQALSTELLFQNLKENDLEEITKNTFEKYRNINNVVVAIHEYSRISPHIENEIIKNQLEGCAKNGNLEEMNKIIFSNNLNPSIAPISTNYKNIRYPISEGKSKLDITQDSEYTSKSDCWDNSNIDTLISDAFHPPLNKVMLRKFNKLKSSFDRFKIKFQNTINHKKLLPAETEKNSELKINNKNSIGEKRAKFTSSLEVDSSRVEQSSNEFDKSINSYLNQNDLKNNMTNNENKQNKVIEERDD